MVKTIVLLTAVVAVIVAGAAAYFLLIAAPQSGTPSSGSSKTVLLTLTEIREGEEGWVPSTIYLKKGDSVKLTVVNGDDDFKHAFVIPDLGVQTGLIPPRNERTTVNFRADRTGTFQFNDPDSPPECKQVSSAEITKREMTFRLATLVDELSNATSVESAKPYVGQLELSVRNYNQTVPSGIAQIVNSLGKATTMSDIASLTDKLDTAVGTLEHSLVPPCIKSGQIIVEP
ncbi:MAG: cupredoxin domain-containing protein [Thaumarchaeota archaeon]|nr:cupredoxin domain-containing protein [Nitrososphaerota archaeon]MCL5318046.1 cupredoxin domain-containing protein [Nitrososphaerota archaeon]